MLKEFWIKKQNGILIIILLSLIVRVVLFQVFDVTNNPNSDFFLHIFSSTSDANGYQQIALNLINTGSFSGNSPTYFFDFLTLDSVRTPGYPIFLAFIYLLFGVSLSHVIAVQIVLNLVSIYLVYRIAIKLFSNKKIALISSFLFSLDVYTIFFIFEIYTETLFLFVLLLSTYLYIKSNKNYGFGALILSGIFLGVSALIKPIAIFLPVIFVFAILLFDKCKIQKKLTRVFTIVFTFLIVVSFWFARNYNEYNKLGFSTISSLNLYVCNSLHTERNLTGKSTAQVTSEFEKNMVNAGVLKQKNPFDNAQIVKKLGVEYANSNKLPFAKQHFQGMINIFFSLGHRQILERLGIPVSEGGENYTASNFKRLLKSSTKQEFIFAIFLIVFLMLIYLAALFGFFSMLKAKEYFSVFLLLGLSFYFTFLTGSVGSPRFRIPIVPFYSIIAAFGISKVLAKF